MYLDKVVERINKIKWHEVGMNFSKAQADVGYEFLRRLAKFFKDEAIKPTSPLIANIASLMGDIDGNISISDYCNTETVEFLENKLYTRYIIQYYIQLAKYADKEPKAIKYLSVYEPLIRLLEIGGLYVLTANELEIVHAAYYPLNNWYEKFVDVEPIDIDEL
ncbi:hypothetical protein [Acetivibrio clariflavus]|uniref:Uncharacterized protein n=1 Tax=Acetivibrio clariflavus (strain DSM 19732 / NBRC 101661 / EBR45) TaxID=720554 RepID=G8M2W0_ACECE|nr:hypothetical protein [Acetivibrio clariflavus]AEV68224.1 hypothetical protein Clocl_1588 [Acetivibrio clariflavus DSM 19732]